MNVGPELLTKMKRGLVVIFVGVGVIVGGRYMNVSAVTAQEQRKAVVCPSFLSIARSARDTLIVMRNDPLCTEYVLDNLQ